MQAWDVFVNEQEKKFGHESIEKWLRSLKVVQFDAANIYLEADDSFQIQWFEEHIRPLLGSLKNNNDRPIDVHLSSSQKKEEKKKEPFFSPSFSIASDPLDPHMTLDNFLSFSGNEMTLKLVEQSLSSESPPFNPLYFYGNSGCGKTHLLQGAALAFQKMGKKAFFVHADTFTQHVVGAMRQGTMQEFRKIYRMVDVLLIDNVHLFSRKSATQEEFFNTFNALHSSGKQIILSSNVAPKQLFAIEPRLISRCEWGIAAPIEECTKEELLTLLEKKSEILGIVLTEDGQRFLLETFAFNWKKIDKALHSLLLRNHHLPNKIDATIAQVSLSDLIEHEAKNSLHPDAIVRVVANHYGIRSQDILGNSHARDFSLPRQIAMYFCRQKLKMPYMKIGEFFHRDHSTVMTSVKALQKSSTAKEDISIALNEIAKNLID